MLKIYIVLLFHCILIGNYSAGFTGSSFHYGSNARGVALSNSSISTYSTGFNSFTNPALLPDIKNNEYGFSHFIMSLDRSIQTISISRPLPPSAGVSLSFFRSGTKNIIETSSDYGDTIGNLNHSEGYGMLSFGIKLGALSAGFNIKAYFNNLDDYSANGIGFDLGALYNLNNNIKLAFKSHNISAGYSWDINSEKYDEDILNNYSIGFSYDSGQKILITSQVDFMPLIVDSIINKDEVFKIYKLGLEYTLDSLNGRNIPIVLRSGIRKNQNSTFSSFGFGIPVKINSQLVLNIDYAIDPGLIDEGISHLFSFTMLNY